MKAKEVTVQIVKNLGNYETIRYEATYTLEGEKVNDAIIQARKELEATHAEIHNKKNGDPEQLPLLTVQDPKFDAICKSLHEGRADLILLLKYYRIDNEALIYLKNKNLI